LTTPVNYGIIDNMPTILCQNVRLDSEGRRVLCNRFLGELTELQIDILKIQPNQRCVFRCPLCPSEIRWVEVRWEGTPTQGKLVFATTDQKPNFNDNLEFDQVNVFEQVG